MDGHLPQHCNGGDSDQSHYKTREKRADRLAKIESLQIKFLRLIRRIGQSLDNPLVGKVLYRLHLATLIRVGESELKKSSFRNGVVREIAKEEEATGRPELDFSFRVLVLGRTGVGKSATINSIFDQVKLVTDPFQPATDEIEEVVGTVNGIRISFIDTPGLLPSSPANLRWNRKVLRSVKKFIRKNPPDIVLYFERLDFINIGYSDFPLLKLVTDIFGPAIWFNTILVMTHSSAALPEDGNGYVVDYESFVTQCTNLVQHYICGVVSNAKLENPVLLVENHSLCKKNTLGEKVLPNGQVWRSHFLLLCICSKVLGDANVLMKFQDGLQIGPASGVRLPSLPHLLSNLLRGHSSSSKVETDSELNSDTDDDEDYDSLPPIRILTKSQFEKLTKSQKDDYLDELDYREVLYLKKQLKAESNKRRDYLNSKEASVTNDDNYDNDDPALEAVQLPDMAIPPSFDSDLPVHRYRCLVLNDQWLARPVLDPQGWDHDVGFDGISMETNLDIRKDLQATVVGQVSKEKQDFSIQSECAAIYTYPKGSTVSAGFDVQTAGRDLICTVHGESELRNYKCNTTGCGISVTSFGNKFFVGGKVEDAINVGKKLKLVLNGGCMGGLGQVAYGGSITASLRGRHYPVRNDITSLTMTFVSFDKENVIGGNFSSEFRLSRDTRMSVSANLNSRKMGRLLIRTSSSERMEIGLIAVASIIRALLRSRGTGDLSAE
ncbi:hypothetical protein Syun_019270 [Stephania yunnanensis]|uniref:AIG1-type G domain-containing protein n=1 Tax=Stephania yunnanensis TaxID=152371 RepID=A0AAP0IVH2_9MAGN